MNRQELDQLDRDTLVRRAEEAGVARARVLTRPELVDELLIRSATDLATRQRSRGLFGRARDLIARVVERGLHLPDAAERIRAMGLSPPPSQEAPAALPTVTLAQIYTAQGHRAKAIETLQGVLDHEPDHALAATLLGRLRDTQYPVPPPVLPPEEEAPGPDVAAEADDPSAAQAGEGAEGVEPARADVDACSAVLVEPRTLRVSWSVRAATLQHVRLTTPDMRLALCVHVVEPTWDGPRPTATCYEIEAVQGAFLARDLPAKCVVMAAVGCLEGDAFAAFAHSGPAETAVVT
jgi:hypothetical protein